MVAKPFATKSAFEALAVEDVEVSDDEEVVQNSSPPPADRCVSNPSLPGPCTRPPIVVRNLPSRPNPNRKRLPSMPVQRNENNSRLQPRPTYRTVHRCPKAILFERHAPNQRRNLIGQVQNPSTCDKQNPTNYTQNLSSQRQNAACWRQNRTSYEQSWISHERNRTRRKQSQSSHEWNRSSHEKNRTSQRPNGVKNDKI